MKIRKIISFLAISFSAILSFSYAPATEAKVSYPERTCEIISQYLDATLPIEAGSASTSVQQVCPPEDYGTFPSAINQDKVGIGHPEPKKTTNQPVSQHTHRYVHITKEDLNNNGKDIFHFVTVDKFEMHLESDFMSNVILDSVECPNLPDGNNCSGVGNLGTVTNGGGTFTLGFITTFDKQKGIITWYFPGSNFAKEVPSSYKPAAGEKWMKPMIDGNNPTLYKLWGSTFDPTPDENRMLERSISFTTKDIKQPHWSATVTSQIYIKEWQGIVDANTKSIANFDAVPWQVFKDYFWFPVGTTTTIWQRPTPNICTELKAYADTTPVNVNGKTGYKFTVDKLTFGPENKIPAATKLLWTSDDPQGEFWKATFLYGDSPDTSKDIPTFIQIGNKGTATSGLTDKIYYVGKGTTVHLKLTGISDAEATPNVCQAYFVIPEIPQELECKDIKVDHPEKIFTNQISTLNSKANATNGKTWPEKIKYSVDSEFGEFYINKPTNLPDNQSKPVNETGDSDLIKFFPNFDPGLIIIGNEQAKQTAATLSIIADLVTGTYGSETPAKYIDQQMAKSNLESLGLPAPKWIDYKIQINPKNGPDQLPVDFKNGSSFDAKSGSISVLDASAFGTDKFGMPDFNSGIQAIDGSKFMTQPKLDPKNALSIDNKLTPQQLKDLTLGNQTKPTNPLSALLDAPLVVDQNTPVYFVGKKGSDGKKVVHVQAQNTTVADCKQDYPIETPPTGNICLNLNYILYYYGTKTDPGNLQNNQIYTIPEAHADYFNSGNIASEHTITYNIDGKYGIFLNIDALNTTESITALAQITALKTANQLSYESLTSKINPKYLKNYLTIGENFPVILVTYTNTPGSKTKVFSIQSTNSTETACIHTRDFVAVPAENICQELKVPNISYNGSIKPGYPQISPYELIPGKIYDINDQVIFTPKDTADNLVTYNINPDYGFFIGVPLPTAATFLTAKTYTKNTLPKNGFFPTTITKPEGETVYLVTFNNIPSGYYPNALTATATGSSVRACEKPVPLRVPVVPPPPPSNVCTSLQLNPLSGAFNPNNGSNNFSITGNFGDHPGNITVSLNGQGHIYKNSDSVSSSTLTFSESEAKSQNMLFSYSLGVDDFTQPVSISVTTQNDPNNTCHKSIPANPTSENVCTSLSLNSADKILDANDSSYTFGNLNVVNTIPDIKFHWQIRGKGWWQEGGSTDFVTPYKDAGPTINYFGAGTSIKVWAVTGYDSKINDSCSDNATVAPEKEKEETPPEITKSVYSSDQSEDDASDRTNISKETRYVNYVVKIKTGKNNKTIEVQDHANDQTDKIGLQKIETENDGIQYGIPGNQKGYLKFESMTIEAKHSNNGYTKIYDTKETYDSHECKSSGQTKFCLSDSSSQSGNDDNIESTFKQGGKIYFKNVDQLGENATILIRYKLSNHTTITDEKCQELSASGEGCGEVFKNQAELDYKSKSGEHDTLDSDIIQVIALCPYILTRSGGDAFFHDILSTGIDVSACYDVKNCVGVCQKPTPPPPPKLSNQGAGDTKPIPSLQRPSHEVCLNSDNNGKNAKNLEGYNNELKNFSSTICELSGEVSEVWTTKYIKQAIAANVTRVANGQGNLTSSSITNITQATDLSQVGNAQSGIFVQTANDLNINGLNGTYTIKSIKGTQVSTGVPAAQTYIVKGHDLYINSDIFYDTGDSVQFTKDSKSIPSAAFIVIDGNIHIGPNVSHIDGIVMAVELTPGKTGKDKLPVGQIIQDLKDGKKIRDKSLTINGNLIGDVNNLFTNRIAVGDPRKDQGSVTIRYDERILLNTPPGISELIDVEQAIVPN